MFDILLYLAGHFFFILGTISFVVAVLFTYLAILIGWVSGERRWEEKASLMGLMALASLPVGGIGGSLLLLRHLFFTPWREWEFWPFVLSGGLYGVFAVAMAAYILFRSPLRLD